MLFPLAEIVSRKFFGATIPGSSAYASVLTLWLGMLGAAIAARDGKLLTLATGEFLPKGRVSAAAHVIAGAVGAMIATILTMGAIVLVQSDRLAGGDAADGVPAVDDVAGDCRHSALYAGRFPPRGGQVVGAAAASVSRVGRLDAGRHGDCRRGALRLFHAVHRRFGCHDPGTGRT